MTATINGFYVDQDGKVNDVSTLAAGRFDLEWRNIRLLGAMDENGQQEIIDQFIFYPDHQSLEAVIGPFEPCKSGTEFPRDERFANLLPAQP